MTRGPAGLVRASTVIGLVALGGCVTPAQPTAQQQAVSACDAWLQAGVGDPVTKPSRRAEKAREAASWAAQAAQRDQQYSELAQTLSQAQQELERENNSAGALVRAPLRARLVQLCAAAGQGP